MSSVLPSLKRLPPVWRRPLLMLALMVAAVIGVYWETAAGMVEIWSRSDTFAHAFLVPPIVLWLVWRLRAHLVQVAPRPMPWILLPMALVVMAWLLGEMVYANALRQFALVSLIVLSVPLILGREVTRIALFPLGYLYFCVPVGEFMLPTLMDWTADFTVAALRLTGVPVYRLGMDFSIPSGNWSVVSACSGVRYLIASLMVGTLFAYINYQSLKRRWLFVGVSILVPIVANWLRAYMIVMLGHLSDNRIATGVDHILYGWVFFGVVILIMFMIGARWSEPDAPVPVSSSGGGHATPNAVRGLWIGPALALLLIVAPPLALRTDASGPGDRAAVSLRLPDSLPGGWQLQAESGPPVWMPRYENPSAHAHALYKQHGGSVGVHVFYYRDQREDRKLVTSSNRLIRRAIDKGWSDLPPQARVIDHAGRPLNWRSTQLIMPVSSVSTDSSRITVWQLYWVNGRLTSSDITARLLGAVQRLSGRGDDGALIILYTRGDPARGADALLSGFAANIDALTDTLRRVRDEP